MRRVALAILLPLLISQSASAAQQSALIPGKPAGIKQAQDQEISTPLIVMGAAAVGIGIALAVSDGGNAPVTAPTTTTTTTTTGTGP